MKADNFQGLNQALSGLQAAAAFNQANERGFIGSSQDGEGVMEDDDDEDYEDEDDYFNDGDDNFAGNDDNEGPVDEDEEYDSDYQED